LRAVSTAFFVYHIKPPADKPTLKTGDFMFKRAKDVVPGDRVFDRGQSFTVKEIRVDRDGLMAFLDTEGVWHGPYNPLEYLGVGGQP
jgi:hypothetical protein